MVQAAIDAFSVVSEMASESKSKKSWKNVLFRPDLNAFSDEEIMSEIVYCASTLAVGGLALLTDRTYKSIVKAVVHLNKAWSLYFEALNIAKYRTKWQHPVCKLLFDTALKMCFAVTSIVVSFAPTKIGKLLTMIGLNSDVETAMTDLRETVSPKDAFFFLPASCSVLTNYGLLDSIQGPGEIRKDIFCQIAEQYVTAGIYGHLSYFILGLRDMVLGRLDSSIAYMDKGRDGLSYLGDTSVFGSVCNLFSYILIGDLTKAIQCVQVLNSVQVKSYLPSLLIYIHAAVLREQMDIESRPELEEVIASQLRYIFAQC